MTIAKIVKKAVRNHDRNRIETGVRRPKAQAPCLSKVPRQSKRWSLKTNGLRQSTIYLWLRCREQFRLQIVEGWASYRTSAAIDHGNLWHWLLDQRHNAKLRTNNLDVYLRKYVDNFRLENPNLPISRINNLQVSLAKTRAMWPEYCSRFPDTWKWLGVEHEFRFKHRVPGLSYPIPLGGIFDGVYEDEKGHLWLFETKTKGQIDEFEIQDAMHLDVQVMLYLYAIKQVFGRWPNGVLYNVIRNPSHRKNMDDPVAYQKQLSKEVVKRSDHFFKRWKMKITPKMIEHWIENSLNPILTDIYLWAEGKSGHYVTTRNLTTKYGRSDMFEVITSNDYSNVYRRKHLIEDLRR